MDDLVKTPRKMEKNRPVPTEQLRQLFNYNADTGELFWKERSVEFFKSQANCDGWNI